MAAASASLSVGVGGQLLFVAVPAVGESVAQHPFWDRRRPWIALRDVEDAGAHGVGVLRGEQCAASPVGQQRFGARTERGAQPRPGGTGGQNGGQGAAGGNSAGGQDRDG